jgi:hypothetical protein
MSKAIDRSFFSKDSVGALLDTTGVVVSWLCVVHCIVLPFAVALLPLAGLSFLLDESIELMIIAVSVAVAALGLLPGYFRQHGRLRAVILFAAGISLLGLGRAAFEDDLALEVVFLLCGAGLITTAHLINRRLCRQCAACSKE